MWRRFASIGFDQAAGQTGSSGIRMGDSTVVVYTVVVLRYPLHATTLLRRTDSQWRPLQAETVPSTLQIFATTDALGRFVAAAPIQPPAGSVWAPYAAAGLLLVLAALIVRRRVFATRNSG